MSQQCVLNFLLALSASPAMLARYDGRNLAQLLFHAKNDGFEFTADDIADVAGRLEASVILAKDQDPFDESSRLWRRMWGRRHLGYLVEHVVRRHTEDELLTLIASAMPAEATG
jgi:hypothetical protein